jgi:putative Mn2+ efflux pump MntP
MDALAVAVTNGAGMAQFRWSEALKLSVLFGLFQGLMPILGWLVGLSFKSYIISVDHWIAFILLLIIGSRMIYHDWQADENEEDIKEKKSTSLRAMIALAIATSIDALVIGIGFIVLPSIVLPLISIGVITFVLCIAGVYLGHKYKHLAGQKVNTIGGVILILIGTKILIEHLLQ